MSPLLRALHHPLHLAVAVALTLLASCQSTIPDENDLARYEEQAAALAQTQIDMLDQRLKRGDISQQQYDEQVDVIRANIRKKAHDLAWTHHELAESEKRAWGIPTGDAPVTPNAPQLGQVANSFYIPKGEVGSGFGSFQNPNMANNYRRGQTPNASIQSERERAVPSEHRRYYAPPEEPYVAPEVYVPEQE